MARKSPLSNEPVVRSPPGGALEAVGRGRLYLGRAGEPQGQTPGSHLGKKLFSPGFLWILLPSLDHWPLVLQSADHTHLSGRPPPVTPQPGPGEAWEGISGG